LAVRGAACSAYVVLAQAAWSACKEAPSACSASGVQEQGERPALLVALAWGSVPAASGESAELLA